MPTDVGSGFCDRLKVSSDSASVPFVQVPGAAEVWAVEGTSVRHVTSTARLVELAGGAPRILKVSAASLAQFSVGAPY